MTATTTEISTKIRAGEDEQYFFNAGTAGLKGTIAVLNGGYVQQGVTGLNLIAVGIFVQTDSNVGGTAGALSTPVKRGKFLLQNSTSADLIAQANVGADCYIVDNQTVALTNGTSTRSRAGKICGVEAGMVWVQIGLGW